MDRFIHDLNIKYFDYVYGKGNKKDNRYHFSITFLDNSKINFDCSSYNLNFGIGSMFYDFKEKR